MRDVAAERAEQQWLLRRCERRIDAATLTAIGAWLDEVRVAFFQELGLNRYIVAAGDPPMTPATGHADLAVDAAVQRTWGVWQNQLENQILPTVSIAFGEAFQQTRRADPRGAFQHQQQYLAEVSDRLRIWPQGAFEDIRPELLEALSDAVTIDEMTERIGRVLNIDARSRELRARINEVEQALAEPNLDRATRGELRALRKSLWEEHDESLNEWQWKARRIARTESHGAVSAGQLAAAREREQQTGVRMWKRWLSTDDTRTRATHRVADGQTCPLDQPFRVGGFLLEHPADSISVAPHEVINCRCTMLLYDDDELQDEFDDQGGKGPVEPGGVRIGPDDAERADEAALQVAEREGRVKPQVGQRGEDAGQQMPDTPVDVELTDERESIPAPDVETATDDRLADYLIRTDEREADELRRQVEAELARRRESEEFEVQYGQPEPADDIIEIDDDGAWLDDPRWSEPPPPDEPFDPEVPFDEWTTGDDLLPGDAVPAAPPELPEQIPTPGSPADDALIAAQRELDEACAAFAEVSDGSDVDLMMERLERMDRAEAAVAEATRLAEVADTGDIGRVDPTPDVTPQADDDRLADERARYAELWGEAAAAEEFDRLTTRRELTPAEQRQRAIWEQAEQLADERGISYEQALAEVQDLDLEQVHRRDFVDRAKREGLVSTNHADLVSELHRRFTLDWVIMCETDCNGQLLKAKYRDLEGGFTADMLWSVNDVTARKYISDEAALWFDEVGARITKADLESMIDAGLITFDAEVCMQEWRRWSGRRMGEDYLR
ncbi:head morphogenesis [Gordonia phage EMoore]|uniref:MuF-like minor capsid protein n=1 Tax=Gordonia phage EMoore TaxID=2656534 RepID=A0A649VUX0_9CAUD|nr:head morphogenesis [Gordonia phage EMoore]QGJ95795.1 MuF-like minor capsid protein [Gordonia phage EMoore]